MSRKATNYAVAFAAGALGIAGVAIATPSPLSAAPVASLTAALKTVAATQLTDVHYYRRGYYGRHHHRHGYVYPYQGFAYPPGAYAYKLVIQATSKKALLPNLRLFEARIGGPDGSIFALPVRRLGRGGFGAIVPVSEGSGATTGLPTCDLATRSCI